MAAFPESALYVGRVMHTRYRPRRHRLAHRVFFLFLDLDRLDDLSSRLRLFAHNKWGVLGFSDRDHGRRDGGAVKAWVEDALRTAGLFDAEGRIYVACFPRMWGYVFNPLSLFYCYDRHGVLRAVLHEVRNTFGELHGYLLRVPEGAGKDDAAFRQSVQKAFHVSPFIPMQARYDFRLAPPGEKLSVAINDYFDGGLGLSAVLVGHRRALSDGALARAVAAHPLMTLKVMAAIHWHALRLWLKGVKVRRKPAAPEADITFGGAGQ